MASELFVDKITGKTGTSGSAPLSMSGNTLTATLGTSSTGFGLTTHVDQWRVESDTTTEGILTNVGQVGTDSFSQIGTAMTESSGYFTFPTTGIYDVSMMGMMRQLNNSNAWCGVQGKATTNNSSYNIAFECYQQIVQASGSSNQYVNFYGHCILDVTNTSNVKFKVSFFADQNEQVYLHGGGSYNQTALKFTRLGDT